MTDQPSRDPRRKRSTTLVAVALAVSMSAIAVNAAQAGTSVARNQVYGMYSGLALLLDIHRPERPNGFGVLYVPGSGFHAPTRFGAAGLKDMQSGYAPGDALARTILDALTEAGYTVFVINHRAAPRFQHPAPLEDARRALRYLRAHAADYDLAADRVCGIGHSSGGTLVSLLGTLDPAPQPDRDDPLNAWSGRLDCVVAIAAPGDMVELASLSGRAGGALAAYFGVALLWDPPGSPSVERYRAGSPVTHVSPGDAPHLLIHGGADEVVPIGQGRDLAAALAASGVEHRLLELAGARHSEFGDDNEREAMTAAVAFIDRHLRPRP